MYARIGTYPVEEILTLIIEEPRENLKILLSRSDYKAFVSKSFNGHMVKMDSLRYQVFKIHGITCVTCGLVGTHFALEAHKPDAVKPNAPYHFNLYGMRNGKEVMLTKDHILPKSKGGMDRIDNMQPMCETCNWAKKDSIAA